tara:strand:- start:134 stop:985 length:852 start_codon:yes stop_codon:yes gene_type:complete
MFNKDKKKNILDLAQEFDESGSNDAQGAPPSPVDASVPQVSVVKDTVASLLENVKNVDLFVEYNLPSLGKLYEGNPEETVKIRALKFSDEKLIQANSSGDRALKALNQVLATCIQGPSYEDLTIPDKLFCLYKIREMSYGSKYVYPVKCESCSDETNLDYELSAMKADYLEGDYDTETTVLLPDSKKTAIVKVLRVSDEEDIASIKQIVEALPNYVLEVEGITDRVILSMFIEGTTVRDIAALRKAIFTPSYGLNPTTDWECGKCGVQNTETIGINSNFFFSS